MESSRYGPSSPEEIGDDAATQNDWDADLLGYDDDNSSDSQVVGFVGEDEENEHELLVIGENDNLHDDTDVSDAKGGVAGRTYQTAQKAVYSVGGTSLTFAQAKLFGLLDESGQVVVPCVQGAYQHNYKGLDFVRKLNKKKPSRESYVRTDDDINCTFAPQRDPRAVAAMKSNKCGYDFANREDKTDFLTRQFATSDQARRKAQKHLEADYEAKIDKLVCPKCKKPQTFDEFQNKMRNCTACQLRFGPAAVVSVEIFHKRLQENEAKRIERLAKIESELYASREFKARPAPQFQKSLLAVPSPPRRIVPEVVRHEVNTAESEKLISKCPAAVTDRWSGKPDLSRLIPETTSSYEASSIGISKTVEHDNLALTVPVAAEAKVESSFRPSGGAKAKSTSRKAVNNSVDITAAGAGSVAVKTKEKRNVKKGKKTGKMTIREIGDDEDDDDSVNNGFDMLYVDDSDAAGKLDPYDRVDEKFFELVKY